MISFITPKRCLIWTENYRDVQGAEPIVWADEKGNIFRVPSLAPSDLASTPPPLWWRLPPFGEYARAARVHDGGYQNRIEGLMASPTDELLDKAKALRQSAVELLAEADEIERGCWAPVNFTRAECDTLLLDGMTVDGVDRDKRDEIYQGVHLFGWKAFRDDRSASPA